MRMIQRGQNTRFAFESRDAFDIGGPDLGENFDCDASTQFGVGRLIHLAHPTRTEMGGDFVVRNAIPYHQEVRAGF
jgi:hypothetical protein